MVLREFLERMREKRSRFDLAKQEDRFAELVQMRKKNSNERELDRFIEEERQKQIKVDLERFRKKRKVEESRVNILKGKNIFKGHKSVLTNNPKLFSMHPSINQGGMFFK